VRHGDTAWSDTGQHTGRTDVPLTPAGEAQAARLAPLLADRSFHLVLTSPRARARATCRQAGFGAVAQVDDDLCEWDYGAYEGRTTADIRAERPTWSLWRDGAPEGEVPAQVAARADRVLARLRDADGAVLVFSHGHLLRVLAARWLGLGPEAGRLFALAPASLSTLGWEREQPVLADWNQTALTRGTEG
jgi:probable phosphoglycerate mutase